MVEEDIEIIMAHEYKKAAAILRACNHKIRQQLINIIHNNPGICVTDIMRHTGLEQSVVSQHLALLRRSGFVTSAVRSKFRCYSLSYNRIDHLNKLMKNLLP